MQKHNEAIKNVVDSFRKMCDYIESELGCSKCPVFNDCFYKNKHNGLKELIDTLE